jgi:lipopolysaccharide transport system ATP-binding protein
VKNYSSGMYVRLGFAVAALSRPDVLLMDEVLAVGDLNFQKRCFDQILQLKRTGTAIILVSHSPGAIWSVCDRGLFMDHGKVLVDGSTEDAIRAYDEQNARNSVASGKQFEVAAAKHGQLQGEEPKAEYGHQKGGTGDVICSEVQLFDEVGAPTTEFGFGRSFEIQAFLDVKLPQEQLLLRFTVDAANYRFIATIDSYEQGLELLRVDAGRYKLRIDVRTPNFRPGAYVLNLGITRREIGVHLFYWFGAARFLIKHPTDTFLYSDNNAIMHLDTTFWLESMTGAAGLPSMSGSQLAHG